MTDSNRTTPMPDDATPPLTPTEQMGARPKTARNYLWFRERVMVMNLEHFHWLTSSWYSIGYERGYEAARNKAVEALR